MLRMNKIYLIPKLYVGFTIMLTTRCIAALSRINPQIRVRVSVVSIVLGLATGEGGLFLDMAHNAT